MLTDVEWTWTEKIDGTNIRIMFDGAAVKFGGKTDNAQIPADLIMRLIELFPVLKFINVGFVDPVCLYGEGFGAGIQKTGKLYGLKKDFILFDVVIGETFLYRQDVENIATKLGISIVPVLFRGGILEAAAQVKSGVKSFFGDFIAEGLVGRPKVELQTKFGKSIITKIKTRDFTGGKE